MPSDILVTAESEASARRIASERHLCSGALEIVWAAVAGTWRFRCGCGEPVLVT
jgi:hypothetical protein